MRLILILSLLLLACGGPAFAPQATIPDAWQEDAGEDGGVPEGDGGPIDACINGMTWCPPNGAFAGFCDDLSGSLSCGTCWHRCSDSAKCIDHICQ